MKIDLALAAAAVAGCALAAGCSYTEHTTVPVAAPPPAVVATPTQSTQTTVYRDQYTGKPLSSEKVVTTQY